MAASQLRAKLTDILIATRELLIADEVYSAEEAFFSMRMNPPQMALAASNQYAIVLPLNQMVDRPQMEAAGRAGIRLKGRMNVYPRNRLALDEQYRSDAWLNSEAGGILDKVNQIVDSLQQTFLPNIDGSTILVTPMTLVYWGEPHQKYQDSSWGDVVVEFEIDYLLNIEQTGD